MLREAAAIAIDLFVEGVDAIADAVGEKRAAAGLVERVQPIPQRVLVGRQIGLPGVMPLGDPRGGRAVLQVGGLDREELATHAHFQASRRRRVLIALHHQPVEQSRHGDMGILGQRVVQRQGTMRGQFAHQSLGQRLDDVVVFLRFALTAECDDGALDQGVRAIGHTGPHGFAFRLDIAVQADRRLVFRPDIAAIDHQAPVTIDADEHTGATDVVGVVESRTILEGRDRRLEFAETFVGRLGQFFSLAVFFFQLVIFRLQRVESELLLGGEDGKRAGQFTQAMGMVVGQFNRDRDPLPA